MTSRESELEDFKTQIDLVGFAEARGYVVDRKKSSRGSVSMVHEGSGEHLIVKKNPNGHFIYTSVHGHGDSGTIIDFLQRRGGGSLGEIRKTLRPWVGGIDLPLSPGATKASGHPRVALESVATDFAAVQRAYEAMSPIAAGYLYLEKERCIPASVYMHPKFCSRIRTDVRGNVVFPHWESGGRLTGYEIKNRGFTGFAKGGAKRLFGSGIDEGDTELVVCETAIDLLSYAALFGIEGRRFVSTAGALNPEQPALLRSAFEKMPEGARVVWAVDADKGGDELVMRFMEVFAEGLSLPLTQARHSPDVRGDDWNDVLRKGGLEGLPHYS